MDKSRVIKISKTLSYALRHKPESLELTLDKNGWAPVKDVLNNLDATMEELETVVAENDKKRFAFNDDKTKIRASQGHSIKVDLQLTAVDPPAILYHGTGPKNINIILTEGLKKMNRHHVHLSATIDTAKAVGQRHTKHGKPIILQVDSAHMRADGIKFYLSENNVYLVDSVDPKYITRL